MTLDTAQPSAATEPPAARGPRGFSIRGRTGRWRDALRRRLLAAADIAAVLTAAAVTGVLADHAEVVLASLPAHVLLAKLYGLYDRDHRRMRHLTSDELADIIAWAATGTLMVVALVAVFDNHDDPAAAAVGLAVATALLCAPMRALARAARRAMVPPERVLVVGSGAAAQATCRNLELFGDMHMQLVGVADPSRSPARSMPLGAGSRGAPGPATGSAARPPWTRTCRRPAGRPPTCDRGHGEQRLAMPARAGVRRVGLRARRRQPGEGVRDVDAPVLVLVDVERARMSIATPPRHVPASMRSPGTPSASTVSTHRRTWRRRRTPTIVWANTGQSLPPRDGVAARPADVEPGVRRVRERLLEPSVCSSRSR